MQNELRDYVRLVKDASFIQACAIVALSLLVILIVLGVIGGLLYLLFSWGFFIAVAVIVGITYLLRNIDV